MEAQLVTEEISHQRRDLPDHLIGFADDAWAVWRCVAVRGAGFPARQVLELASPETAAAATRLLDAEEQLDQARLHALDLLRCELDAAVETERGAIFSAISRLKKGKLPKSFAETGDAAAAINAFKDAIQQLADLQTAYSETFNGSFAPVSRSLVKASQDKRFREAVIWQNRDALHTGIDRLLTMPITDGYPSSVRRNRERLVANYLQRYCTKNDTIGFFGPLGWARFVSEGDAVNVTSGANIIAAREVSFESWALDTFAAALAKDHNLQPWLAPRQFSYVHFDGSTLRLPFERPVQLPRNVATVLRTCDGERTAKEIAGDLSRNHAGSFRNETEIYTLLEMLRQRGVIEWTMEVPWTLDFPRQRHLEDNVRRLLNRIGDDTLRERALSTFEELDAARLAVAHAGGDDEAVDHALGQLAETFHRLTGSATTRNSGKTYAGRTLVYEDCLRDIDVKFGPDILKQLEAPLPLLLTSARWFTHQVAQVYREVFRRTYNDLVKASGSTAVEGAAFWSTVQPYFFDPKLRLVDSLMPRFQDMWAEILSIPEDTRRVHYDSAELSDRVHAMFAAPKAGWPFARYHSPDLMIAAADEDAIRRGDYQLVMGELHIGMNTLGALLFLSLHREIDDLMGWLDIDVPEPRLVPVTPKSMVTARTQPVFISEKALRLELTRDPSSIPRSRVLTIGSLVVEDVDGELCIRTRDHALRFDILDAFADVLSALTVNSLKLLRPAKHTPRVSFDRLIVCRETWRFTPAEIDFAFINDEQQRFLTARRWMRKHAIPRFVFVKTPIEIKPTYLDFESPILIEMFAKAVRQSADANDAAPISMSEMIPNHEQIWLPDFEGNRYTSEFRIVAVDQLR